jgi:hypothetical protein
MIYGSDTTLQKPRAMRATQAINGQPQQAASVQTPQAQQPQTFAQMRDAGQARPAPAAVPPALRQAVAANVQQPTAYGAPQAMDTFSRLNAALSEQFGLQRRNVNQQMSKRGLYDSTTAVGALGDVAIQQARAQSELAGQIAEQQALREQQDRASAISQGFQLAGIDQNQQQFDVQQELARILGIGGMDLQRQQLGQQDRQFDAGQTLDRERLAQQGSQFQMDNQMQRDALLQQLAMFLGLPSGFGLDATGTDTTMEAVPGATFTYGNATPSYGSYL